MVFSLKLCVGNVQSRKRKVAVIDEKDTRRSSESDYKKASWEGGSNNLVKYYVGKGLNVKFMRVTSVGGFVGHRHILSFKTEPRITTQSKHPKLLKSQLN